MKNQIEKTNVLRILDQKKINYTPHFYYETNAVSGLEICEALNEEPSRVFKSLVTVGHSNNHYVFLVPVDMDLDLKKAAKAVNEKNVQMIKSKELLPLTGYIHGGCSPIGMKKQFVTVIDESAKNYGTVYFSAGKIGYQVEMNILDLKKVINFEFADIKGEKSDFEM